jgi:hypothetical protein
LQWCAFSLVRPGGKQLANAVVIIGEKLPLHSNPFPGVRAGFFRVLPDFVNCPSESETPSDNQIQRFNKAPKNAES